MPSGAAETQALHVGVVCRTLSVGVVVMCLMDYSTQENGIYPEGALFISHTVITHSHVSISSFKFQDLVLVLVLVLVQVLQQLVQVLVLVLVLQQLVQVLVLVLVQVLVLAF